MLLPSILLLVAAEEPAALPGLTIDPCVQVDAEEVRRLASIELTGWSADRSPAELDVTVSCADGVQQVRLVDRARDRITVRSIDLGATEVFDRDAKARELSLVIAELLRRAVAERAAEERPPPKPLAPPPPAPRPQPIPTPHSGHWTGELGISGVVVGWTGGEVWFGADAGGRLHLGRFLIAEAQVGARTTRTVDLAVGTIEGVGFAGRVGLAVDVTPGFHGAGLALGASLGGDVIRYVAVDRDDAEYGGGRAGAVSAAGTATGFVNIAGPLCLTLRTSVGGPLHSIAIRNNGGLVSGARGVLVAGSLGVTTQF